MWCRACQQDVPGVSSPDDSAMRCARCRAIVASPPAAEDWPEPSLVPGDAETERSDPFRAAQWSAEWDFDEELAEADRMLRRAGVPRPKFLLRRAGEQCRPTAIERVDLPPPVPKLKLRFAPRPARNKNLPILPRLMADLGVVGFLTGVTMLVWSFVVGQAPLWQCGLAVAMGGQVILVAGLVAQFDYFRRSHREADQNLSNVDKQLTELRQATTRLSNSPDDSGRSFYVHMAEGASPHILLADLKGQLDTLAQRLARDE
jgi:hypothetical protein